MTRIPDRLKQLPGKHFIRLAKHDKKPIDRNWTTSPLAHSDPQLLQHLQRGGNYGVVGGYGLTVVDVDDGELKEQAEAKLPETFTVETPGSKGWHLYFLCSLENPIRLRDKNGGNLGDIQGPGKQVVGPTCIHPNGGAYKIIHDAPLAQVTPKDLREAFKDYVVPEREIQQVHTAAKHEKSKVDFNLNILDVVPLGFLKKQGREYYGPHPVHGSKGGKNFWVDPSKDVWHCFRHGTGGGPLSYLAVDQGIIRCCDATPGALRGDKFHKVLKAARENELIPDVQDDHPEHEFIVDDKVNCRLLADQIMTDHVFKTENPAEEIYCYNPTAGIYEGDADLLIKKEVVNLLGDLAKEHYFNETKFIIEGSTYFEAEEQLLENEVAVENGILNVKSSELTEFTSDKFLTQKLPVTYNADAGCPKIRQFIADVVGDQQVRLIQEFIGYCLYKKYNIDKAFMLVGDGANGKSTLLELITRLIGQENVSTQTLQNLCNSRFAAAELHHKLANICADLPDKALHYTGFFKMLTGGDEITGERKYRDPFTFKNHAKIIFSTNKIPETNDDTIAFFRRWIIISCNNYFPPNKANPNILDEICTPEEMSGLLNWALKGLKRLLENKRFSDNKTLEEYRQHYIRSSNSALAFIEENLITTRDPQAHIEKKQLYQTYLKWCAKLNLPTKRQAEYTKTMTQELPGTQLGQKRIGDRRPRVWLNITFNPDSDLEKLVGLPSRDPEKQERL